MTNFKDSPISNKLVDSLPTVAFNNLLSITKDYVTNSGVLFISVLPGSGLSLMIKFLLKHLSNWPDYKISWVRGSPLDLYNYLSENERSLNEKDIILWRTSDQWNSSPSALAVNDKIYALRNITGFSLIGIGPFTWFLNPDWILGNYSVLFKYNHYIGPLEGDAYMLHLQHTARQLSVSLTNKLARDIYGLSGGIARIFKYILVLQKYRPQITVNELTLEEFLEFPSLYFEFKFLSSLLDKYNEKILYKLGIIDTYGQIKSDLLKMYYSTYYQKYRVNNHNAKTETILTNHADLNDVDKAIIKILIETKSSKKYISLSDLQYKLNLRGLNYKSDSLYKLVQRLREKLENSNVKIINKRGLGYRLQVGW